MASNLAITMINCGIKRNQIKLKLTTTGRTSAYLNPDYQVYKLESFNSAIVRESS